MRIIGAAAVFFAACAVGLKKSHELKMRRDMLLKIITSLELLEKEITYSKRDTKSILSSIGDTQNLPFLTEAAESMPHLSCRDALRRGIDRTITAEKDKYALYLLADTLGTSDAKSQRSVIAQVCALLSEAHSEAAADYAVNGKLYRSAGILTGLLTVILLS